MCNIICKNCGKTFKWANNQKIYCPDCKKKMLNQKQCMYCGIVYERKDVNSTFCSQSCRKKHFRRQSWPTCELCKGTGIKRGEECYHCKGSGYEPIQRKAS